MDKANEQIHELDRIAKMLVRRDFNVSQIRTRQEDQIRELDHIAKMLVRRDLELLETNEAMRLLDEAKAKDDALLASIGDGIIATDIKEKIILINAAAEAMIGWKKSEVMGKDWFNVMPVESEDGKALARNKRPIQLSFSRGKKISTSKYYYVRRDKTRFPVAITTSPVLVRGGIKGAVVVFRDVTREKQIDRAKSEFVSLASHQLRTPLSTVNWYAEMLLAGDMGEINKGQRKYLGEIYHSNQRMIELVNALLNVSRIELGTLAIEPEPINLIKITGSVIRELLPHIKQKALKIKKDYDKNFPIIRADPKLMRIVFQNLLSNAVKYTPQGGRIVLTIHKQQPDVLITVADTGYGIPKAQQSKIFTKLFRADNIREIDADGTGLGLYIVKEVLEQSGGKIWFESPASPKTARFDLVRSDSETRRAKARRASRGGEENKGTTFYVTLPLGGTKRKGGTKGLLYSTN